MLTLLARMGLRAGRSQGCAWTTSTGGTGRSPSRGKGGRSDRLPLPADVGRGGRGYLQHGRPAGALDRGVFVRIKAPHQGPDPGGVTQAVIAAARRAGLGTIYAHRLRHSAATAMLRRRRVAGGDRAGPAAPPRADHSDPTPRSTSRRCAPWPARGREARHDRAARRRWPTTWTCAAAWVSSWTATRSCWSSSSPTSTSTARPRSPSTDALAWATLPEAASPGWLRMRMSVVRGFAAYLHTLDPTCRAPRGPAARRDAPRRALPVLGRRSRRTVRARPSTLQTPLRPATIRTLIGLLAVTGMRLGEVVALDDEDFDAGRRRAAGAARASSASSACCRCTRPRLTALQRLPRDQRTSVFPRPVSPALLVSSAGHPAAQLQRRPDLRQARPPGRAGAAGPASCRPRPHDLRHTFAVPTLLDWYRDGGDIAARLPLLSTYLGHARPRTPTGTWTPRPSCSPRPPAGWHPHREDRR